MSLDDEQVARVALALVRVLRWLAADSGLAPLEAFLNEGATLATEDERAALMRLLQHEVEAGRVRETARQGFSFSTGVH